jgi:lipid-A-disaccharide synthase
MISCGEASGDLYAGALVQAVRARDAHVEVFGFGGPTLARAGADLVGNYAGFSVTGLVEAASVLARSRRMLAALGAAARDRRPDVFVAIDFPDFNFQLLPVIHGLGIPIVYYVSPQLWAWRAGRMTTIQRYVSRMLVIFPFETAMYEKAGVPVEFVGHPLLDLAAASAPREEWLARLRLDPARPVVALLPGSRPNEVRRILPVLARAMPLVAARLPDVQFVVARAPSLEDRLFAPLTAHRDHRAPVAIVANATDDALAAADAVVTASGTATIQTALHGAPMVIVYRLAPLTYAMGRAVVRVPAYGMVNLVAGRHVVPELIQRAFTAERVAAEILSLLTDRARADAMRRDLAEVRAALGGPGASARAADAVLAAAASGPHVRTPL